MYKKVMLGFLMAVVVGSLLFATGVEDGGGKAEGPVTLKIWDIYPEGAPFRAVLDGAIERFKSSTPGFEVESISYGDMSNYKTKFATMIASGGKDTDIFQTWGGGQLAMYARKGFVLDLTEEMSSDGWGEQFAEAALTFVSSDDKIWGVPIELANVMFYYNTELFEKNNLDVPVTFDELLAVSKKLKENDIIPIVLALNKAEWVGDFIYQYLVTRVGGLDPFMEAIARSPGASFEDPAFIEAAELLQTMVASGCFQEGFMGTEYGSMRQIFTQEKAAMMLMGSWLPGQIAKEAPQMYQKVDFFKFPAVKGGQGQITDIVGGTNASFAVLSATKYPEQVISLMKEFSSQETADDVLGVAKRLPAVKYDFEQSEMDSLTRRIANELNESTGIQLYYDQASTPSLAQTHLSLIASLFANTITPKEASAEWEAAAEKELR